MFEQFDTTVLVKLVELHNQQKWCWSIGQDDGYGFECRVWTIKQPPGKRKVIICRGKNIQEAVSKVLKELNIGV